MRVSSYVAALNDDLDIDCTQLAGPLIMPNAIPSISKRSRRRYYALQLQVFLSASYAFELFGTRSSNNYPYSTWTLNLHQYA